MPYDFSSLKGKIKEVEEWFARELNTVRTGRATSAILDTVRVESYGSKVPLNQVAGISTEDARTLRITPWDKGQIREIEKALQVASLGISVIVDEAGLRVIFPDLTAERRTALLKVVKQKSEEARVALRRARDDVWSDIQEKERTGSISKDEKFRYKDEMERLVGEANKKIDEMALKKEKEIGV